MNKRKICVVITARPSYSRVKTVLKALKNSKSLELQLILAGSALISKYGNMAQIIKDDGFEINAKVYNLLVVENETAMAKTTSIAIMELSNVFFNMKPDAVLTIADRYETLGTSIAAAYQNIPLIHLQGGEVTGNIDEKVRHANTKLADIHFVSSKLAKDRLIKMGENSDNVYNTGCPSVDIARVVLEKPKMDFDIYEKYGGVGSKPKIDAEYLIVMQHPETNEYKNAKKHIIETLAAVHELKIPAIWFWPNVDAGSDGTSAGIRYFRENFDINNVQFIKNIEPSDFLKLLINSSCIVGNSSVAIRECNFLGVKAVNVGKRQIGRQRGSNVLDVDYDKNQILNAIKKQITSKKINGEQIYGDGYSGERIVKILEKIEFNYTKILSY